MTRKDFVIGDPTHETLSADCPKCGHRNIQNRTDDLKTDQAIARTETKCEKCGHLFAIGGDLINPTHERLLFDAGPYLHRKEHAEVVQRVARAYEAFFARTLRIQLVLRPFYRGFKDLSDAQELQEQLSEHTKRHTFEPLRHLFLKIIVERVVPNNVADARETIKDLPDKNYKMKKETVEAVTDPKLQPLLLGIYETGINSLRNRVMHKEAYQPSWEEAEAAYTEGSRLIHNLGFQLGLQGDDNYYINGRDRA
jgi:hypothetical protein